MPLPAEPTYPTLLAFLPNGAQPIAGLPGSEVETWEAEIERLDLRFNQYDDVLIPVTFEGVDMSTWAWYAQIRTARTAWAPLVAEFSCYATWFPPAGEVPGRTVVTMILFREKNVYKGDYFWDLHSVTPLASGPPPVPPEPDETPGFARTWVWGKVHVDPFVTRLPDEWPIVSSPYQGTSVFLAITTGTGKTVGPTGQVG